MKVRKTLIYTQRIKFGEIDDTKEFKEIEEIYHEIEEKCPDMVCTGLYEKALEVNVYKE